MMNAIYRCREVPRDGEVSGESRQGATRWRYGRQLWQGVALAIACANTGCSLDGLLHSDQVPANLSDPAYTETPDGAVQAYQGTLNVFRGAYDGFVLSTGLLTDEIQSLDAAGLGTGGLDQRMLVEGRTNPTDDLYENLSRVRGNALQALGLLTDFAPDLLDLKARLYALEGYAEVFLAEYFCSGIPLSTVDYHGDFTYKPGSSTDQVLTHAIALFDTALALAVDSGGIANLARLGRARALLGLGNYAAAAAEVTAIPSDYHYDVHYSALAVALADSTSIARFNNFADSSGFRINGPSGLSIPDQQGINGMAWRTSSDPRTTVTVFSGYYPHPDKYSVAGDSPIRLADAVEARLIEAEAALQSGSPTWLDIVNALRTDGTFDTTAASPPDTLWHAGTGGVAGLKPLADPGTADGRIDLLFRERAFWLFLTGHRQGDLRRLIRQYGRSESDVYPIGPYPGSTLPYSGAVTAPVPSTEKASNPLYTGCISNQA